MKQMKPILLIIAMLIFAIPSYAQVTGILKGKVVDEDGKGLIGAVVKVEGTVRGAKVKEKDGTFTVVNIPAGQYNVKITYVGLQDYNTPVTISANQTVEISAMLTASAKDMKAIDVVADKINVTDVGKVQKMGTDELRSTASNGINAMVATSAGVTTSGAGFSIRGARSEDTQVKVDGLEVGNQFTGGYGVTGSGYYPMASSIGTEEVQVITGGMGAEYGSSMGGVVNTVAKRGKTNAYEIAMNYRTDLSSLNGYQSDGVRVRKEGNRLIAEDHGEGLQMQGQNEHLFEFGFGGPLQLLENSTFYLSGYNRTEEFRGADYKNFDPLGNNLGQMPNSSAWVKNIQGRIMLPVSDAISLNFGGSWGMTNIETSSLGWLYANDEGIINGVSNGMAERIAKQPVINQLITTFFGKINHSLSESSFYEIQFSYSVNNEDQARRKTADNPGFFSGFEVYEPKDEYKYSGEKLGWEKVTDQFQADKRLDIYSNEEYKSTTRDSLISDFQTAMINPFTGYYEGNAYNQGTNNAWGIPLIFNSHGNPSANTERRGIEFRYGTYMQVDGNYTSDFKVGDFSHTFKAGFEFRTYTVERHNNVTPWESETTYDIFSDKFGGNLYTQDENEEVLTEKAFNPWRSSIFVQDQIKFQGLILTPGLRLDLFNPNAKYRVNPDEGIAGVATQITNPDKWADATVKVMFSPRINITYPINKTSSFSMNYGIYYKMPEIQNLYDNLNIALLRGGGKTVANTNVDPQRTNDYQVTYNAQMAQNMSLSISAYYKDIYNQFGYIYYAQETPFWLGAVTEYGNNKGIEFELSRPLLDNYGFRLNYTLAQVTGTAAEAGSNLNNVFDIYQANSARVLPLAPYNLGRDIRHRVNVSLDAGLYDDEGPKVFDTYIFDNMRFNISGNFRSGAPYTQEVSSGAEVSEKNILRGPSAWNANLKVSKRFLMKDWFGEDMGNASVEVYFDVFNFLNNTQAVGVYAVSSDPLDDGVNLKREIGTFQDVDWYKEGSWGRPASVNANQYDYYGNRKYNKQADLDNNDVVTQEEVYQQYIKYVETIFKNRGNYQIPRTVMFGIQFAFN